MIEWITFGSEEFLRCFVLIRPSIKERFSLSVQCGAHEEGQIISIPSVYLGLSGVCVLSFFLLLPVICSLPFFYFYFFTNESIDFCDQLMWQRVENINFYQHCSYFLCVQYVVINASDTSHICGAKQSREA